MKITGIELEEKDILYILTDALETSAISYWADEYDWDRVKSEDDDLDGCVERILIKELNKEETNFTIPHTIDREIIRLGVDRIVKGEVQALLVREMILDDDIDSDGCDCIIQAGLFGEIKYS